MIRDASALEINPSFRASITSTMNASHSFGLAWAGAHIIADMNISTIAVVVLIIVVIVLNETN